MIERITLQGILTCVIAVLLFIFQSLKYLFTWTKALEKQNAENSYVTTACSTISSDSKPNDNDAFENFIRAQEIIQKRFDNPLLVAEDEPKADDDPIPRAKFASYDDIRNRKAQFTDRLIDDSYVARGLGLIASTVGRQTEFYLYSKYDNDFKNVSIEIKGRNGKRGTTRISDGIFKLTDDGDDRKSIPVGYAFDRDRVRVTYTPLAEGVHTLTLSRDRVPICRSPYYVSVEKSPTNSRSRIRLGTKKYKPVAKPGKSVKHAPVEVQTRVPAVDSGKSDEGTNYAVTDVMSIVTKFESRTTATKTKHQTRMASITERGPEIDVADRQQGPNDDDGGRATERIDRRGENVETAGDEPETKDVPPVNPVSFRQNMSNAGKQDPTFEIDKQPATKKNDLGTSKLFTVDRSENDEPSAGNEETTVDSNEPAVTNSMFEPPKSFSKEIYFGQHDTDSTEYNIGTPFASVLTKISNGVCLKCSEHVFSVVSQLPRDLHITHDTNSSEIRPNFETLLAQPIKININIDNVLGNTNNKSATDKSAYPQQFDNSTNVEPRETNSEILKRHSPDVNEFFDHNPEKLCSQANNISSIPIDNHGKCGSEINETSKEKRKDTTLVSSIQNEVEIDRIVLSNGTLLEKCSTDESRGISINSDVATDNTDDNSENKTTQAFNLNVIESDRFDENVEKTSNDFVEGCDLTLVRSNSLTNYDTENISDVQNEDKSKSIENMVISDENNQKHIINDSVLASINVTLANLKPKHLDNDQKTTNIYETNDQNSVLTTVSDVNHKIMIEKSFEPILESFKKQIVENILQFCLNKDSLNMNHIQFSEIRNTEQINESLETKLHNHAYSEEFLNTENKDKQVENNEVLVTQVNSGIDENNISKTMTAKHCPDYNKLNECIENLVKHIAIPNKNHEGPAIETKFQKIAMHQPHDQQKNSFNGDIDKEKIAKIQSDVLEALILNCSTGPILSNNPENLGQQNTTDDQTTTNSTGLLMQNCCKAEELNESNLEISNAEHALPMSNNNETMSVHRTTDLCATSKDLALDLCATVTVEETIKTETVLPNIDKYDDSTTTTTDILPQKNVFNVSEFMTTNKTNPAEMVTTNEFIRTKDVEIDELEQLNEVDTKFTLETPISKGVENNEINIPNIVENETINSNIIGMHVMNEPPVLSDFDIDINKLPNSNEFETAAETTIQNDTGCIATERKNSIDTYTLSETKKIEYSKSMFSNRETRFKLPLLNINEIVVIETSNSLKDIKISTDIVDSKCTAVVTIEIGTNITNTNLAIDEPSVEDIKMKTNIPKPNTSESIMVKESNEVDIDMLAMSEEMHDVKNGTLDNKTVPEKKLPNFSVTADTNKTETTVDIPTISRGKKDILKEQDKNETNTEDEITLLKNNNIIVVENPTTMCKETTNKTKDQPDVITAFKPSIAEMNATSEIQPIIYFETISKKESALKGIKITSEQLISNDNKSKETEKVSKVEKETDIAIINEIQNFTKDEAVQNSLSLNHSYTEKEKKTSENDAKELPEFIDSRNITVENSIPNEIKTITNTLKDNLNKIVTVEQLNTDKETCSILSKDENNINLANTTDHLSKNTVETIIPKKVNTTTPNTSTINNTEKIIPITDVVVENPSLINIITLSEQKYTSDNQNQDYKEVSKVNSIQIPVLEKSKAVDVKITSENQISILSQMNEMEELKGKRKIIETPNKTLKTELANELQEVEIGTIYKIPASSNTTDVPLKESIDTEQETLHTNLKLNDSIAKLEEEAKEMHVGVKPHNIESNKILDEMIHESVEIHTDTTYEIPDSNEVEIKIDVFLAPELDNQPIISESNDNDKGLSPQNTISSDFIPKEEVHESYKKDDLSENFITNSIQTKFFEPSEEEIVKTTVPIIPKLFDKIIEPEVSDMTVDIITKTSIASTEQAEIINENFEKYNDTTSKISASNVIQSELVTEIKEVERETEVYYAPNADDQPVKSEANGNNLDFISKNTIPNIIEDELNNKTFKNSTSSEKSVSNNTYEKLIKENYETVVEIGVCVTTESNDTTKLKSKDIDTEIILQNTTSNDTPTEAITDVFATDINTSSETLDSDDIQTKHAFERKDVKTETVVITTPKSNDATESKVETEKTEIETISVIVQSSYSNISKPIEESKQIDTDFVLQYSILPNVPVETIDDKTVNSKMDFTSKTLEHNNVYNKSVETSKREIMDILYETSASNESQAIFKEKLIETVLQTFPGISSNVNFEETRTDQIEIITENPILSETQILPVEESKKINVDILLANRISADKHTTPLEGTNEININSTPATLNETYNITFEETMVETDIMTSETQNNLKSAPKSPDESKEICETELCNETLTILENNDQIEEEFSTKFQTLAFSQTKSISADPKDANIEFLTRTNINDSKTIAINESKETGIKSVIGNPPCEIALIVPSTIESKTLPQISTPNDAQILSSKDPIEVKIDMMSVYQTISDTTDEPEIKSNEHEITTLIKHPNSNETPVLSSKNLEKVETDTKYETLNTKDTDSNLIAKIPETDKSSVAKLSSNDKCTAIFEEPKMDEIKIITDSPKSNDSNNFKEPNNVENYTISLKSKDTQIDTINETTKESKIKEIIHTENEFRYTNILTEPVLNDNKTTSTEASLAAKKDHITAKIITNETNFVVENEIKNIPTEIMITTPNANENIICDKASNEIFLLTKSDVPIINCNQVVPKAILNNTDNSVIEEQSVGEIKTTTNNIMLNSQSVTVKDSKNIEIEDTSILPASNINSDKPNIEPNNLDKEILDNTSTFDDVSTLLITKLNQTEISTEELKEIDVGMLFTKPIYIEFPVESIRELEQIKIETTSTFSISTPTLPSTSEELREEEIDISSKILPQDLDEVSSKELNTFEIEIFVPNGSQNVSIENSNETENEPISPTTNKDYYNNPATMADELKEIELYNTNEISPNLNTITTIESGTIETEINTNTTTIDCTIYAAESKEIDVGILFAKPVYEPTDTPTVMMIRELDQKEISIISNESLPPLLDKLNIGEIDTSPGILQEISSNITTIEQNTLEKVLTKPNDSQNVSVEYSNKMETEPISNDSQNVSVEYSNEMEMEPISVTPTTNNSPDVPIDKLQKSEVYSSNENILRLASNVPTIKSSKIETEITGKIPILDYTQAMSVVEQNKIETGILFAKPMCVESSTIVREPESIETESTSKTPVSNGTLPSLLDELKIVEINTEILQEDVRNIIPKEPNMLVKEITTHIPTLGYIQAISIEEPKEIETGMLFAKSTYDEYPHVSIKESKEVEIETATDTEVLTDTSLLPVEERNKVEKYVMFETSQENSTSKKQTILEKFIETEISISSDSQLLSEKDSTETELEHISTSHTTNVNVSSTLKEPHTMVETEIATIVSKINGTQNLSFKESTELKTESCFANLSSNENAFAPTNEPKEIKIENTNHSLLNKTTNKNMTQTNLIETKLTGEMSNLNTTEEIFIDEPKIEDSISCTLKSNLAECNITELVDDLKVTTSNKTLLVPSFEPTDEPDPVNTLGDALISDETENVAEESKLLFKSQCLSTLRSGEADISKVINVNSKTITNQNETETNNRWPEMKEMIPESQQPNFAKTSVTNDLLDVSESTSIASDVSNSETGSIEMPITVNIKSEPKTIEELQHTKQDNTYYEPISKTAMLEPKKTSDETKIGDSEKKNTIADDVDRKSLEGDRSAESKREFIEESFEELMKKTFETRLPHNVETKLLYSKLNDLITTTLKEEIKSNVGTENETEKSDFSEGFARNAEKSVKGPFDDDDDDDDDSQEKSFGVQKLELSLRRCTKTSADDYFEKTYVQLEQTEQISQGEISPSGTESENKTTATDPEKPYPVNESDLNAILCASSLQEALTLLDSKIKFKFKHGARRPSSRIDSAIYKTSVETSTSNSSSDKNTNFTEAREFFKKIEQKSKK